MKLVNFEEIKASKKVKKLIAELQEKVNYNKNEADDIKQIIERKLREIVGDVSDEEFDKVRNLFRREKNQSLLIHAIYSTLFGMQLKV